MPTQHEIRQDITNRIVASIKSGTMPWRRPWKTSKNSGAPANVVSRNCYRGVNPLLLELVAMDAGYGSRWWGTYRQWNNLGGQVRRGERGTKIVFAKPIVKTEVSKDGDEVENRFTLLRYFTVFNAEQVEGCEQFKAEVESAEAIPNPDYAPADELIEATGADIRYVGDKAVYLRGGDFILMPPRDRFNGGEFYETAFHELAHWSECRLNWTGSYALGELIAEISSCYVCSELGLPLRQFDNHAAYVEHWLGQLENDPRMIFEASSQASKVADFLLGFRRQEQRPEIMTTQEFVFATVEGMEWTTITSC